MKPSEACNNTGTEEITDIYQKIPNNTDKKKSLETNIKNQREKVELYEKQTALNKTVLLRNNVIV